MLKSQLVVVGRFTSLYRRNSTYQDYRWSFPSAVLQHPNSDLHDLRDPGCCYRL
jgi:hypothetical protein